MFIKAAIKTYIFLLFVNKLFVDGKKKNKQAKLVY